MKRIGFWICAALVLSAATIMDALHPLHTGPVAVAFPFAALAIIAAPLIQRMLQGGNNPSSQTGSQQSTSTSMPGFSPEFSPLLTQVMGLMKDRLNSGGLPPGYEAKGLSDINKSAELIRGGLTRRLTASGQLGGPTEAAATGNLEGQRLGSVSDFLTETPLKAREMQGQDLASAMAFLGLGRGTTTTSSGTQTGQFTPPAPNTFGDMASLAAYLQASGAFRGGSGGGSPGFGQQFGDG